ncbi:MAG TPA: hypothetical protein DHW82_11990 [Spirochaetia bacterium]|nr:MAG: hypothetical protein A2Y41_12525 [Spirochaetes bacterium GWB1_36_13]HCL57711.1 hypothetical protein [Spirochaetia bacterium]
MEFNEILKKFVDTSLGLASVMGEKMGEFAEQMSKKGEEFKVGKKEEIENFFNGIKGKFEEMGTNFTNFSKNFQDRDEKITVLQKEVETLKKEVAELKKNK